MGVAPHDEVKQMVAGAGAALIYDSGHGTERALN